FEPRGPHALEGYLKQAVRNRIVDEHRKLMPHRLDAPLDAGYADDGPSPLQQAITEETVRRYRAALANLRHEEQELVVGRCELGYSHEQLAVMAGCRSADAARVGMKRALLRLVE